MDRIIYERDVDGKPSYINTEDDEPTRIALDIPSGMDIDGFKTICKRLASAIGFPESSIEDAFGNETVTPEEMIVQAHIRDMIQIDYTGSGSLGSLEGLQNSGSL